ncbi:MAG: hypothetical protein GX491_15665 [Chloroflexi bacterium]|nr:hypothetical protein [Chloroflexota bacterium]
MQRPLRIGILLDSYIQPRWVYRIIADIQNSMIARVALVVLNGHVVDQEGARQPGLLQKVIDHRGDLVYLLYHKIDRRLFRPKPDAFELVDTRSLLIDCPTLIVKPVQKKFSDYLEPDDAEAIRSAGLDVALRFGFRILRGGFLKIARFGVWSYHHGDNLVNRGGPPGFWEVMEGSPVTGSILQILSEKLDGGEVIYRSYAATEPYSVILNKNAYYWKSSAFVMRKLKDLYENGPQALARECSNGHYQPYSHRLYTQPRNAEMVRLLWRLARRYTAAKIAYVTGIYQWFLAFQVGMSAHSSPSLYRFTRLTPPKDRFWADPFPIKRDERYYIFIEEYMYAKKKGTIAVIEMDQNGNWQPPVTVLERDYHLSYPFVFEWQGHYFMIPETAEQKTIELYRCTRFPDQWQFERVIMQGVNAVDTTLVEIDGVWWMFTNIAEEGASKNDELYVFYAKSPLGPWSAHRGNPVKSDARSARPAGRLFKWNGAWYRPSQDCSQTYGHAVVLNEIVRLDPNCFEEREVSRLLPNWEKGLLATHTLNRVGGLTVVDALKRRRKWL